MKIEGTKRINSEDFDAKDKPLIERLSRIVNDHMEQVTNILTKNVDISNLKQEYKDIDLEVDSSGTPKIPTAFKNGLTTKIVGMQVIYAVSLVNPAIYVTGAPFVTFTEDNSIIKILNVKGLPANSKFRIRVITYS